MKVLVITNLFPNSREPVRGVFTKQIVKELKGVCEVKVVAPLPWAPNIIANNQKYVYRDVPENETIEGIDVFHPRYFVTPKIGRSFYGFFFFITLFPKVLRLYREFNFDLIYVPWVYPDGFGSYLIGKLMRKPVVIGALGSDINIATQYYLRRKLIAFALRHCSRVISVSESLKEKIISLGVPEEQVAVIPNGVNTALFRQLDQKQCLNALGLPADRKSILFIGNLVPVKGIEYLMEAFKVLKIKEHIQLIIIGEGELRLSLEEKARKLGIIDRIRFEGSQPHDKIPLWMNACDVFCLPSINEGMPNVVIEAMSCGIPIVATNVGGIPEIIVDCSDGLLVPPRDVNALTCALDTALGKERGKSKRRIVSWEENARMHLDEFEKFVKFSGNKLRIMYVNYSLGVGGIETLLLEICSRLDHGRFTPLVCVFEKDGKLRDEFINAGINVHTIEKRKGFDFLLPFKLARLCREEKIHILHGNNKSAWLYGALAAKLAGIPFIYTQHNTVRHLSGFKLRKWHFIEKMLSLITSRIAAVSDSVARYMTDVEHIQTEKICVIHNGIDPTLFTCADGTDEKEKLGITGAELIVGNIARFFPAKDHRTLLHAFRIIVEKVNSAQLLIAGEGPLREEMEKLTEELCITANVKFLGNRRDIPSLLNSFDIFALSSLKEGLPVVILEAMASGLPVVATDVDGNPELVLNGETGLVIPPEDPDRLANAILRLHTDRQVARQMGVSGRKRVEENFSLTNMMKAYEELYLSLFRSQNVKKLLVITNLFPNSVDPSRGIYNSQQLRELSHNFELQVIAPLPWAPYGFGIWKEYRLVPAHEVIDGMDVHHPRYFLIPKIGRSLYGFFFFLSLYFKVRLLRKEYNFDMIYATWVYPDGFGSALIAKLLGVPIVIKAHGSDINSYSRYFLRRKMIAWALRSSNGVVAVSGAMKQRMEEIGVSPDKIKVILNGVDTGKFRQASQSECRNNLNLPLDKKIILFVGNFVPVKGLDILLDAFKIIHQKRDDWRLILLGDGLLHDSLTDQAHMLGLEDMILFPGKQTHGKIPVWINSCDVLCLPSHDEGCPNVVLEAFACGKPVVATKVGGIPEIIDSDAYGVLVHSCDALLLAEGINKAMNKNWDHTAISRKGFGRNWNTVAEELGALLNRAYNN